MTLTKMSALRAITLMVAVGGALLSGCATFSRPPAPTGSSTLSFPVESSPRNAEALPNTEVSAGVPPVAQAELQRDKESLRKVYLGSDQLFKLPAQRSEQSSGEFKFTFESMDVREAVRSILGETLQENYLVDPQVTGTVTLRTPKGVARADLIPTLEVILRQANAVLVKDGPLWRVQPAAAGLRGVGRPTLSRGPNSGYGMTLVPLQYIGVNEMMRMLDTLVKEPLGQGGAGGSVRPEPLRNMLIITGTPAEQQYILDTVDMFDVDWMSGMSVGLFTLEHSDAKKVIEEVDKVLGGLTVGAAGSAPAGATSGGLGGPLFGLVRVQLIERLNALLVVSPQRRMIEQAEVWIRRLDRGGSADSSRMYVYNLQYTSAEKLAPVLQQAMSGRVTTTTSAQTAPGQNPLSISTPVVGQAPTSPAQPNQAVQRPVSPQAGAAGGGTALARNATIIPDKDRNALLIVASPAEYSAIEQAIKKLDVLPRQVMVEVTVVEVDLTDDLALGVEWAASRDRFAGTATERNRIGGTLGNAGLGLAFARTDLVGSILKILDVSLNAKDGRKRARIHASPKLMAVDNTPVTFNVGRSVSVQTSAVTTPGTTTTTTTTNSYQYLQTGISVSITPRISAGGLVNLEITQEISEPIVASSAAASANPNPDISKTALKNTVLAQDGETIVMAGLIREKISDNSQGLPGISRVPFLGGLFGSQGYNVDKQEILVLVRPVVVTSIDSARSASVEIQGKMHALREVFFSEGLTRKVGEPLSIERQDMDGGLRLTPDLRKETHLQ